MIFTKPIGAAFFALVVLFAAFTHGAEAGSQIESDIEVIQSEIQTAQKAFGHVRKSKGKNTQELDASIERLRSRINALNASLKDSKPGYGISLKNVTKSASHLNGYLRSLEKARAQSDWRAVERDLQRLNSSAKGLHSAALNIPEAPDTASRTPPKPPTVGTSGSPDSAYTPKPKPAYKPRTVVPHKPPLPVTPGPGPKGPDDPRFAMPPAPVEEPEPPPPPDDGGRYSASPMSLEEPRGPAGPPMARKPAQPPVSARDNIPKPKPISLRNGTKMYFASGQSRIQDRGPVDLPDKLSVKKPRPLSKAQISEAISHIRQAYNVTPKSTTGSSEESGSLQPVITLSPIQQKSDHRSADVGGRTVGYRDCFYELEKGDHYPWGYDINAPGGRAGAKNEDRIYCKYESELWIDPDNSEVIIPRHYESQIIFHILLFPDVIYLADITITGHKPVLNGEIMEPIDNHILYVFTKEDFSGPSSWSLNRLHMYCLDEDDRSRSFLRFNKIEIYQIN